MTAKRAKFHFETTTCGRATVLRLCDTHYHADSLEALEAKFRETEAAVSGEDGGGEIIVDLSAVALLSSTALRALRTAFRRLEERGGRIVAAGGGELVVGVLKFAPFIAHYPSVEDAAAALGPVASQEDEKGLR